MAIGISKTTTYNETTIDFHVSVNSGISQIGNPPTNVDTHTLTVNINDQLFFTKAGLTDGDITNLVAAKEEEAKRYIDRNNARSQPLISKLEGLGFSLDS